MKECNNLMFAPYEGQRYAKLPPKVVEDPEAGERLAIAFPFEIKMKLQDSHLRSRGIQVFPYISTLI